MIPNCWTDYCLYHYLSVPDKEEIFVAGIFIASNLTQTQIQIKSKRGSGQDYEDKK